MLNLRPSAFEIEARGARSIVAGNAAAAAQSERIESNFMMLNWQFAVGRRPAMVFRRALIGTHHDYSQYLPESERHKTLRLKLDYMEIVHRSGSSLWGSIVAKVVV